MIDRGAERLSGPAALGLSLRRGGQLRMPQRKSRKKRKTCCIGFSTPPGGSEEQAYAERRERHNLFFPRRKGGAHTPIRKHTPSFHKVAILMKAKPRETLYVSAVVRLVP